MKSKEIVTYALGNSGFNWAQQMNLCKKLQTNYSDLEIIYAIDYYKRKGIEMKSLGFLTYKNNMKDPVSLFKAELNTASEVDDSGTRNRRKVEQNNKTYGRKESYFDLFEES